MLLTVHFEPGSRRVAIHRSGMEVVYQGYFREQGGVIDAMLPLAAVGVVQGPALVAVVSAKHAGNDHGITVVGCHNNGGAGPQDPNHGRRNNQNVSKTAHYPDKVLQLTVRVKAAAIVVV